MATLKVRLKVLVMNEDEDWLILNLAVQDTITFDKRNPAKVKPAQRTLAGQIKTALEEMGLTVAELSDEE